LVDRVPMACFLTKMAAVASEKTICTSFPGIMLWLCEATLPPAPIERRGGARVEIASRGAPAAEKVAGAPSVAGASRAPQGHLFRKFGRGGWAAEGASGGTRGTKWAKTYPYVRSWAQRDLVKTSRKRYVETDVFQEQIGASRLVGWADFSVVAARCAADSSARGTQLAARGPSGNRRPSAKVYTRRYTESRTGAITPPWEKMPKWNMKTNRPRAAA
jgi:hypothetical protein